MGNFRWFLSHQFTIRGKTTEKCLFIIFTNLRILLSCQTKKYSRKKSFQTNKCVRRFGGSLTDSGFLRLIVKIIYCDSQNKLKFMNWPPLCRTILRTTMERYNSLGFGPSVCKMFVQCIYLYIVSPTAKKVFIAPFCSFLLYSA
jgi:hypothetical protein